MLTRWYDYGFGDVERRLAEFDVLRRELNRLFEGGRAPRRTMRAGAGSWPRIGLFDRGEALLLRAEVPGVANDDLEINLDQGVLSLKGERKAEVPEGYSVHRQERGSLSFSRSFSLPCQVDAEKAKATLTDGVLTLSLPKMPEAKPRQIAVNTK